MECAWDGARPREDGDGWACGAHGDKILAEHDYLAICMVCTKDGSMNSASRGLEMLGRVKDELDKVGRCRSRGRAGDKKVLSAIVLLEKQLHQ